MFSDEFGYPIPGKYEYILDLQKLMELLRTKAEIARQTANSDWQQQANLAGVDSTVFLRDRELVLYDLTTKAAATGQHCTAFKTLSSELVGMSVEAWKRIKEQEAGCGRPA